MSSLDFNRITNNKGTTQSNSQKEPTMKNYSSIILMNNKNKYSNQIKSKRFSATIREIDYNAYRAYKMANENKNWNTNKTDNINVLNNSYNPMRYPFGLKAKRFKWQTDASSNSAFLEGNLKKYTNQSNFTWNDLMKRSMTQKKQRFIGDTKAFNFAIFADINSVRTIEPNRDLIPDDNIKKRRQIKKSWSMGSIANLINVTPMNESIRIRDRITRGNNIFGSEFNTDIRFRRQKSSVNWNEIKRRGNYAGWYQIEKSINSFSYKNDTQISYNINEGAVRNMIDYSREYSIVNTGGQPHISRIKRNNSSILRFHPCTANDYYTPKSVTIDNSNWKNENKSLPITRNKTVQDDKMINTFGNGWSRKSNRSEYNTNNAIKNKRRAPVGRWGIKEFTFDYKSCQHEN